MLGTKDAPLSAASPVRISEPGPPPADVGWVRDIRLNPRTRRQLIEGFWKGHKNVSGQVAYVANESDRDRLRRKGMIMINLRDVSAQKVTIIIPAKFVRHA